MAGTGNNLWTPGLEGAVEQLAEVAGYLWQRGWAERNAGNVSLDVTALVGPRRPDPLARVPERIPHPELNGRFFLVKATGARFREVARRPESGLLLLRVNDDQDGYEVLWGGSGHSGRATSEFISHLRVHGLLASGGLPFRAVLHTHPSHLIALTHLAGLCEERALNRVLWSMHPEVKVFVPEGVGLASYRMPGTEELADVTVAALVRHRIVLWEKHGCVAVGRDVHGAFDLIDTVNKSAELYLLCKAAGHTPQGLGADQVKQLGETYGSRKLDEELPGVPTADGESTADSR